jgi:hypothetical protein
MKMPWTPAAVREEHLPAAGGAVPADAPGAADAPAAPAPVAAPIPPPSAPSTPDWAVQETPEEPLIGDVSKAPIVARLSGLDTAMPAVRADAGLLGGLWVAGASLSGMRHRHRGQTGQDAFGFGAARDGSGIVIVACDGVGQHELTSQIGADLLTRALVRHAAGLDGAAVLADPLGALGSALVEANKDVQRIRATMLPDIEDRHLASTAALCWISVRPDRPEAHALRIGDGNVFGLADGKLKRCFPMPDGAINEVEAYLPAPKPLASVEHKALDTRELDLIAATTDGLAIDLVDSTEVHEWVARRWERPGDPVHLIETLRYRRRGSADDRTAACAWLRPQSAKPAKPDAAPDVGEP